MDTPTTTNDNVDAINAFGKRILLNYNPNTDYVFVKWCHEITNNNSDMVKEQE
jgi:hypothetical protein